MAAREPASTKRARLGAAARQASSAARVPSALTRMNSAASVERRMPARWITTSCPATAARRVAGSVASPVTSSAPSARSAVAPAAVEDAHGVPACREGPNQGRAQEAGAAGDEGAHEAMGSTAG